MDRNVLISELSAQYGYEKNEALEIIESYEKSDTYEFLCDFLLAKMLSSAYVE